jgi:hypothetical protein
LIVRLGVELRYTELHGHEYVVHLRADVERNRLEAKAMQREHRPIAMRTFIVIAVENGRAGASVDNPLRMHRLMRTGFSPGAL